MGYDVQVSENTEPEPAEPVEPPEDWQANAHAEEYESDPAVTVTEDET